MAEQTWSSPLGAIPSLDALSDFARLVAHIFDLPDALVSQESSADPYSFSDLRKRWGTSSRGIELHDRTDITDRGHYTMDYRSVTVQSYGLEPGVQVRAVFGSDSVQCAVKTTTDGDAARFIQAVQAVCNGSIRTALAADPPKVSQVDLDRLARNAAATARNAHWQETLPPAQLVLKHRPGDLDTRLALAVANLALGRTAPAQQEFQQILKQNPKHAEALYHLGFLKLAGGETAVALRLLAAYEAAPRMTFLYPGKPWLPEVQAALQRLRSN